MSLLVFDLGNTRCKWAPAGHGLRAPGRALEYGADFAAVLDREFSAAKPPTRIAAVTVTGSDRFGLLKAWVNNRWSLDVEQIQPVLRGFGVSNSYRPPQQLGADRWAALVAARRRDAGAVCIVDAGTAVTIDALDSRGVFRGGVILPGLAMQRMALQSGTDGVAETDGSSRTPLGLSTADAVAAGTFLGLVGAIDHLLAVQTRQLGETTQVLMTGGDASRFQANLNHRAIVVPDLVLEGVARMAEEMP